MECPWGTYIQVYDTFYGRENGSVCMSMSSRDSWPCVNRTAQPFNTTSAHCNGRRNCNIYNGMEIFNNPCPDMDVNRYLNITYACVPCFNSHSSNDECDYWMSWYECENNPYWMYDKCFKSCSGCQVAENCGNVEDDNMCDYWSLIGECANNAAWMRQNCAKSCRTCWAN